MEDHHTAEGGFVYRVQEERDKGVTAGTDFASNHKTSNHHDGQQPIDQELQRYSLLFREARDIILFIRRDGRIVEVNEAAVKAYGFSRAELLSMTIQQLRAAEAAASTEAQMAQADSSGILFETAHRRKDGTSFPVEVSSQGASLGNERVLLSIVRDITDRKRTEDSLRRSEAMLADAQEQRVKYVLGISHGLRTPLTVVQGQAQLLLQVAERLDLDPRMKRSSRAIVVSAQRMSVMLRDLVDLMHLESGEPLKLNLAPVEMADFVLALKDRWAGLLDTERITLDAQGELPSMLVDPDRMERVLMNLMSNALKFSDPGSPVAVAISQAPGLIIVDVANRGPGIPSEELPHLFEPYRRRQLSLERPESVGLGLYVAKGLVEAHGGQIWVRSEEGMGATVSFTLPTE